MHTKNFNSPLLSILGLVLLCSFAAAEDPERVTPQTIGKVIDLIVAEHFESPAPQQMALTAARGFLQRTEEPVYFELAKKIGQLSDTEDIVAFLESLDGKWQYEGNVEDPWHAALDAMVSHCGGRLMATKKAEVDDSFASNTYVGIGILLTMQDDGHPAIAGLVPDGPAMRNRIEPGDQILTIDGISPHGWSIADTVDALRGPRGSELTLELRGIGAERDRSRKVTLTRDLVSTDTIGDLEVQSGPAREIGYIELKSIKSSTGHELRKREAEALSAGLKGIILDLRNTAGGREHDTVMLANALLDEGSDIGRSRSRSKGVRDYTAEAGRLFEDFPVVALIGENTDGSVEWLAAALKRNQAAILVGNPTAGNPIRVSQSFAIPQSDWVVELPHAMLEISPTERAGAKPGTRKQALSRSAAPGRPIIRSVTTSVLPDVEMEHGPDADSLQLFRTPIPSAFGKPEPEPSGVPSASDAWTQFDQMTLDQAIETLREKIDERNEKLKK